MDIYDDSPNVSATMRDVAIAWAIFGALFLGMALVSELGTFIEVTPPVFSEDVEATFEYQVNL